MWFGTNWLSNPIFWAGAILVWLVVIILFLLWYEPRLIFYPQHPSRTLEQTPYAMGIDFEEVALRTADNVQIHGWFLKSSLTPPGDLKKTILFLHGNAGNISHRLKKSRLFIELGLDVLLIDYRGYGQSEGKPREKGTYRDADAAYEYLTLQRHLKSDDILIYGESLGTGVTVDLASRRPVGGVILEAAFTSIPEVAKRLFRGLPVDAIVRNRYDSLRKISHINTPLLLLHSTNDELFPFSYAERLFAAAREPKKLMALRGSHNDAVFDSWPIFFAEIRSFLE